MRGLEGRGACTRLGSLPGEWPGTAGEEGTGVWGLGEGKWAHIRTFTHINIGISQAQYRKEDC